MSKSYSLCFDETPVQLVGETHQALPLKAGQPAHYDYEYHREGTTNLSMFFAPVQNRRHVTMNERRTKADWVMCMHDLVYVHFPQAKCCVLVKDQLNTHDTVSLYVFFETAKAKRILDSLEFHFTPKHDNWLNIAEIEFSVLSHQFLDEHIPDLLTLAQEIGVWEMARRSKGEMVIWRFPTADTSIKHKKLYPTLRLPAKVKVPPLIKA